MANPEHLKILKQGVEVWNKWRQENTEIRPDFNGADLTKAVLCEANLWNADLRGANLTKASLIGAKLSRADLSRANISEANLSDTNLKGADLRGANLHRSHFDYADLKGANLKGANLSEAIFFLVNLTTAELCGAKFSKVILGGTVFSSVNLSAVDGLDDTLHIEASTVGTDTLQNFKGKISEAFLRGCGLSDWEIESAKLYNPDLSNQEIDEILYRMHDLRASQALQISPLFISYSHADSEFVDAIEEQLNDKGIRFWRDIHKMKVGRVEKQIDDAIRHHPTVLVVLSRNSIKSDWVEHEVRTARALEKNLGRDVLCPVALDNTWETARWPTRIIEQLMEYNILDFSDWQDEDKFSRQFRKLIDGLDIFYK